MIRIGIPLGVGEQTLHDGYITVYINEETIINSPNVSFSTVSSDFKQSSKLT